GRRRRGARLRRTGRDHHRAGLHRAAARIRARARDRRARGRARPAAGRDRPGAGGGGGPMTTLTSLAGAPRIDLLVAAPVLAPAIGAVLVLALDALWPRRRWPAVLLGPLALVVALAASVVLRLRAGTEGGLATVCLPKDPA